jgi:hypothetical protein
MLHTQSLQTVKTKITHKKQRFEGLYYGFTLLETLSAIRVPGKSV